MKITIRFTESGYVLPGESHECQWWVQGNSVLLRRPDGKYQTVPVAWNPLAINGKDFESTSGYLWQGAHEAILEHTPKDCAILDIEIFDYQVTIWSV